MLVIDAVKLDPVPTRAGAESHLEGRRGKFQIESGGRGGKQRDEASKERSNLEDTNARKGSTEGGLMELREAKGALRFLPPFSR